VLKEFFTLKIYIDDCSNPAGNYPMTLKIVMMKVANNHGHQTWAQEKMIK